MDARHMRGHPTRETCGREFLVVPFGRAAIESPVAWLPPHASPKRADVLEVLKSFRAWRGSKNNHAAITLFRSAGADRWTRVEGLASASQLAEVWRKNVT